MSAPFMEWKEEPLSPLSTEEAAWLSEDNFYQTSSDVPAKFEVDLIPCESKAEAATLLLENLESLIDLDELIKEEPFLLDEKILPILEEVAPARPSHKLEYVANPSNTHFLLKEFENVYNVIELAHDTLTPPQSPPCETKILTTLEPIHPQAQYAATSIGQPLAAYAVPEKPLLADAFRVIADYPSAGTPQPDIAHELAVVDELVRTRVEDMQWSSSAPSSPNSNSSGSSNFGDCSSDDPEWTPEPVENYENPTSPKQSRKRGKPYSRGAHVDKKVRKKEQNKNAATRYRMKKKAEVEVILSEEKQLSLFNDDLDTKIKDLQREIKYLKGLMRDLFKAKGLIN